MKYFVFSDPHGNYEALLTTIISIMGYDASNPQHQLIGCGDYFGRAAQGLSDCVNIWNYLISPHHKNAPICIRGNHESIILDAIEREQLTTTDIYNGEHNTFASFLNVYPAQMQYDSDLQRDAAKELIKVGFYDWLKSLPWYFETKNCIFTHGFVPMSYFTRGVKLEDFKEGDWERASWCATSDCIIALDETKVKPSKTIVFGHWRAKDLNERFAGKWETHDGGIYVDTNRNLIGLDTTTILSGVVGHIILVSEGDKNE